jgi:DNA-binding NarL/FixJ family response regulator
MTMSDLPAAIRILVADDHPLMLAGLAAVAQDEGGMQVVAQAGNGEQAVALWRLHRPDVGVLDVRMPLLDGVDACARICTEFPEARIVMLTTYRGDVQTRRALQAGASGYLLKSMVRTELLAAIRTVHGGRRHVPPEVAADLSSHQLDEPLTPREVDVLGQVAAGNSNRAVAEQLGLSEDSIKAYMKKIMGKLAARDRTHAVMIAIRRGILGD